MLWAHGSLHIDAPILIGWYHCVVNAIGFTRELQTDLIDTFPEVEISVHRVK